MHRTKKGLAVFGELLGLAIALAVNIYLLPLLPFVTGEYYHWLPVGNAALVISAVFDIAKYFVPRRMYYFLKGVAILPDIYSAYLLASLFPFQFALIGYNQLNRIIRVALYLGVFGTAVGCIVNIVKTFTFRENDGGSRAVSAGASAGRD